MKNNKIKSVFMALILSACSSEGENTENQGETQSTDQTTETHASPTIGTAFSALNQGNFSKALEDINTVLEGRPDYAAAMFIKGRALVGAGDIEEGWLWLLKARETNQFNTTNIDLTPQAEVLREDPRYQRLFPRADDYNDPFVEGNKIIHEWVGETQGDVFGWIARNIGDVDGDGIDDATNSATAYNNSAGKVYTYSGKSGDLLWTSVGEPGDQLGSGLNDVGDVNGDGIGDVGAGAPGGDYALVLSGQDGSLIYKLSGNAPEGPENFGNDLQSPGDIDNDGHDEILVGAPGNSEFASGAGAVYLFSGKTGELLAKKLGEGENHGFGTVSVGGEGFMIIGAPGFEGGGKGYVFKDLNADPIFTIDPVESSRQLGGMFGSVVGDINNDGTPDIYLSDWADAHLGPQTGRIMVVSGTDGEILYNIAGSTAGEGFGIGVADTGDINKDGFDDLLVGSWQFASHAPSGGLVTIISGLNGEVLNKITGKVMGETFGFDATGMGDVDGDGYIDYLLTSAYSAIKGAQTGRTFIVSGAPPE